MADLVLTAASVVPSAYAVILSGTAGAAITAGQTIFEDTADLDANGRPKIKLYDANASAPTAITNGVRGIALNNAATGQPVDYAISDPDFTHGLAGVTKGDVIVASATAGGLAPVADLASGWRPAVMLIATSSTKAVLQIAQNITAK